MTLLAPSLAASGDSWATFKGNRLVGHLEDLITANSSGNAAPTSAPTASATGGGASGGSLAAGTYYLKFTEVNGVGETTASPESSLLTVASGNIPQVTFPSLKSGNTGRNLYVTPVNGASGAEVLYASGITTTTYNLSGAAPSGQPAPPTANTTGLSASQTALIRDAEAGGGVRAGLQHAWQKAASVVDNYLEGNPDSNTADVQSIVDVVVALAVLSTCLLEVANLISANPGTISNVFNPSSGGVQPTRTLP